MKKGETGPSHRVRSTDVLQVECGEYEANYTQTQLSRAIDYFCPYMFD